jgi:transketolase
MSVKTYNFSDKIPTANSADIYERKLIELAGIHKNIFLVSSDSQKPGSHVFEFKQLYPDRFVDVGIAEANLVGIAAGLALSGKIPFGQTFGPFLSIRATDQIHTDIAYNDVPVRLVGTHGGLTSAAGPTHNTILDYAIMRAIPNMTMVAPSDPNQCARLIEASITYPKPLYIRIPKGDDPLIYANQDYEFTIGKAILTKEGKSATIIGTGIGVYISLKAAQQLEEEQIDVRVLDMHTIKPLDKEAIIKAAKETGVIVTVEDHSILGGLGSAVAEVVLEAGIPCKFKRLGIPDVFAALGNANELYTYYGYDSESVKRQVKSML